MTPTAVTAAQAAGATILDVQPFLAFAAAHLGEALSIPLRPAFASWLGWIANHERPIVAVRRWCYRRCSPATASAARSISLSVTK